MELDYIIVGFGLSGLALADHLDVQNKSFIVFDNAFFSSSRVAGGVFNPVVLKRFTAPWNIDAFINKAIPFYKQVVNKLNDVNMLKNQPVLRRFDSIEEQNKWFEACDKPLLERFLSDQLISYATRELNTPFKLGEVKHTGRIMLSTMLDAYISYLDTASSYRNEGFHYDELSYVDKMWVYGNVKAKYILFAEGHRVMDNIFFKDLPIQGNKGEYLIIKSPELKLDFIFKSSVFIIPLGDDLYKVGATFDREDKTLSTTQNARDEIVHKLEKVLNVDYEIVDQVAGIRPTVGDRKPILGRHAIHKGMYVFNGMGSRGILTAPLCAEWLIDHIELRKKINPLVDVSRFYS